MTSGEKFVAGHKHCIFFLYGQKHSKKGEIPVQLEIAPELRSVSHPAAIFLGVMVLSGEIKKLWLCRNPLAFFELVWKLRG